MSCGVFLRVRPVPVSEAQALAQIGLTITGYAHAYVTPWQWLPDAALARVRIYETDALMRPASDA